MAMTMVECMKELCQKQGKTIICTIHQPSSEVFELFDTLCLMAEGRLAYLGPVVEANKHFVSLGYPTPADFNPSDHYSNLKKKFVSSSRMFILIFLYFNSSNSGCSAMESRRMSRDRRSKYLFFQIICFLFIFLLA
jgi:ABC-type multidrug transport system ATPase subunit